MIPQDSFTYKFYDSESHGICIKNVFLLVFDTDFIFRLVVALILCKSKYKHENKGICSV